MQLTNFIIKGVKVSLLRLVLMNFFTVFVCFGSLAWIFIQFFCLINDVSFVELVNMNVNKKFYQWKKKFIFS